MDSHKKIQKWMETPEAKTIETAAQKSAWAVFTKKFLNMDKSKFVAHVEVDEKNNVSQKYFLDSPTSLQSVFGSTKIFLANG